MQKIDVKIMLCLISIIVTLFLMYHLQDVYKRQEMKQRNTWQGKYNT